MRQKALEFFTTCVTFTLKAWKFGGELPDAWLLLMWFECVWLAGWCRYLTEVCGGVKARNVRTRPLCWSWSGDRTAVYGRSCTPVLTENAEKWSESHVTSYARQYAHKYERFLNLYLVRARLVIVVFCKGLVCSFVCFCVNFNHFGFVLLVLLGWVFSVPSQEIVWEERLRNNIFCVEWGIKTCSILALTVLSMQ